MRLFTEYRIDELHCCHRRRTRQCECFDEETLEFGDSFLRDAVDLDGLHLWLFCAGSCRASFDGSWRGC